MRYTVIRLIQGVIGIAVCFSLWFIVMPPATAQAEPYDWSRVSLNQMPPIASDGAIDGTPYIGQVGYDLSRTWQQGDTPDRYLKLGDLSSSLAAEQFSLDTIAQVIGGDPNAVAMSAFDLAKEQALNTLNQVVQGLSERIVASLGPIADLIKQVRPELLNQTLGQALSQVPQLGELQLGQLGDLSQYAIGDIPGLSAVPLQQLDQWGNGFVSGIPGLGSVPLGAMPNPLGGGGGILLRIDMMYGTAETDRQHTISGSEQAGFNVSCKENCAYLELLDDMAPQDAPMQGMQWISGKFQEVPGGSGCLQPMFGGQEPTGRHPYGSLFKQAIWDVDETTDTATSAIFFRVETQCGKSPYGIGPVMFMTYARDNPIFVGQLQSGGGGGGSSSSTGASPGSASGGTPGTTTTQSGGIDCDLLTATGQVVQGVSLDGLRQSISAIESRGSGDYVAVGTHGCDADNLCGRGLGKYQFMNYNEYASDRIEKRSGGKDFLQRVRNGHRPSAAEINKYFPPADQEAAFQASLSDNLRSVAKQTDPKTGKPFTGDRLIERVAQIHYGGAGLPVDSGSTRGYGQKALKNYKDNGGKPKCQNKPATAKPGNTAPKSTSQPGQKAQQAKPTNPPKAQPVGQSAKGKATGTLGKPLQGPVTSGYGPRVNPVTGEHGVHAGIDIPVPTGTGVGSADGGKVVHVGWLGNYGNTVIVEHGNGRQTLYAHLSKMNVKKGELVAKWQKIGEVGSTGRSTGPHLHWEVIEGAKPGDIHSGHTVDPMVYLGK